MVFQEKYWVNKEEAGWAAQKSGYEAWICQKDVNSDDYYFEIEKGGDIVFDSRKLNGYYASKKEAEQASEDWIDMHK